MTYNTLTTYTFYDFITIHKNRNKDYLKAPLTLVIINLLLLTVAQNWFSIADNLHSLINPNNKKIKHQRPNVSTIQTH